jgi:biotin carboxyl carrier protein
MNLPRAKEFMDWKPEGYFKTVEELRQEVGPGLSDDDLLLKILIPGKPAKSAEVQRTPESPVAKAAATMGSAVDSPTEFLVEVDGEVFNVKVSPVWNGAEKAETASQAQGIGKRTKELPSGAVVSGMAGLVLSLEVKVGDRVNAGDLVVMMEAMKMRRHITSPHGGVVREIFAREGEIVQPDDLLMVVD